MLDGNSGMGYTYLSSNEVKVGEGLLQIADRGLKLKKSASNLVLQIGDSSTTLFTDFSVCHDVCDLNNRI